MVSYRPKERISINEIKKHPWLKELFKNLGDIDQEEKIEYGKNSNQSDKKKLSSPKKNKEKATKILSHNPSFNKKEKNNNNLETQSSFSEGYSKDQLNENNLLAIHSNEEKYMKNGANSKAKEYEMKYMKELSLRKISIDNILKDQEDDAD